MEHIDYWKATSATRRAGSRALALNKNGSKVLYGPVQKKQQNGSKHGFVGGKGHMHVSCCLTRLGCKHELDLPVVVITCYRTLLVAVLKARTSQRADG